MLGPCQPTKMGRIQCPPPQLEGGREEGKPPWVPFQRDSKGGLSRQVGSFFGIREEGPLRDLEEMVNKGV